MKLCLVGSSRFMDEYLELNRRPSLAGHIVYSIATRSTSADYDPSKTDSLTEDEKETLDLVHLKKIEGSEGVVLVTNDEGYIGASTKRELKWAQMHELGIFVTPTSIEGLCNFLDPNPGKGVRKALRVDRRYRDREQDEDEV